MIYLFIFQVLVWIIAVYMFFRIHRVAKRRIKMIDFIYDQPDWQDRRKTMDNPSFGEMVFQFWKPVSSYYKEYIK